MKILNVNKFYYRKGGSEAYFFGLADLLKENKHEVIPFSMKDKKNYDSKYNKYFVENISYENMGIKEKLSNGAKLIYSVEAKNKAKKIVSDCNPDIAHLHIFQHQLSPSILKQIKKNGTYIVNTVHDLKVVCPNYKMLNNDEICEKCKTDKFINCFKTKCIKGSTVNSLLNTIEAYTHRILKSYDYVDKFICPSQFYSDKFIEFGIPKEKVVHIPNFVDTSKIKPNYDFEDYFVYFGRLSEEKGIKTLIESMKLIKKSKLIIVGNGPLEEELKLIVKNNNINNIEFVGFKTGIELENIVKNSKFVVIPSEWYENAPMSIIEAMSYGKPVIGSNIGGIPEFIEHNNTGLIFEAKDSIDLENKIDTLLNNESKVKEMGRKARARAEKLYDKKVHYEKIMSLYNELMNSGK
ncbi:glycosyltransferase family 4 protein [Romboutsia sp.]|uniref:glycosyltransferase family 4 protein n=1 Tax=Romboutsia sp. TaxID=1965302 RepID=UPI003F411EE8